jgi:hypothetical protein
MLTVLNSRPRLRLSVAPHRVAQPATHSQGGQLHTLQRAQPNHSSLVPVRQIATPPQPAVERSTCVALHTFSRLALRAQRPANPEKTAALEPRA